MTEVFATEVYTRWGDMDALGHVNNAALVTILEEGRVRFLAHLATTAGFEVNSADFGMVVARHELDYRRTITYAAEPLPVQVWVDRIGTSSFTVGCAILQSGVLAVQAQTVVVAIAKADGSPVPLSAEARRSLAQFTRD